MLYLLAAQSTTRAHRAPPSGPSCVDRVRTWFTDLFPCSRPVVRDTSATSATPAPPPVPVVAEPVDPVTPPSDPSAPTARDVTDRVHAYVDAWYEANKDGVDIGRIDLPLIGTVDVFPDEREKALYRKVFTMLVTNLLEVEVKVAGVSMRLTAVAEGTEEAASVAAPSPVASVPDRV